MSSPQVPNSFRLGKHSIQVRRSRQRLSVLNARLLCADLINCGQSVVTSLVVKRPPTRRTSRPLPSYLDTPVSDAGGARSDLCRSPAFCVPTRDVGRKPVGDLLGVQPRLYTKGLPSRPARPSRPSGALLPSRSSKTYPRHYERLSSLVREVLLSEAGL